MGRQEKHRRRLDTTYHFRMLRAATTLVRATPTPCFDSASTSCGSCRCRYLPASVVLMPCLQRPTAAAATSALPLPPLAGWLLVDPVSCPALAVRPVAVGLVRTATKKAGGSSKNGRDSQAKRLGVKLFGGCVPRLAVAGSRVVRERCVAAPLAAGLQCRARVICQ